jgi:hypothetical protein
MLLPNKSRAKSQSRKENVCKLSGFATLRDFFSHNCLKKLNLMTLCFGTAQPDKKYNKKICFYPRFHEVNPLNPRSIITFQNRQV